MVTHGVRPAHVEAIADRVAEARRAYRLARRGYNRSVRLGIWEYQLHYDGMMKCTKRKLSHARKAYDRAARRKQK